MAWLEATPISSLGYVVRIDDETIRIALSQSLSAVNIRDLTSPVQAVRESGEQAWTMDITASQSHTLKGSSAGTGIKDNSGI